MASRRAALALTMAIAACHKAPADTDGGASTEAGAGLAASAASAADASFASTLSKARFETDVRPVLSAHGCAAASCHGTFRGGGLFLKNAPSDFENVAAVVDAAHPMDSLLLRKALGRMPHVGGRNLALDACDTQRLVAWMSSAGQPACTQVAAADGEPRFERELRPALGALGCTASDCHGNAHPSKLDLSHLDDAPAQARASVLATGLNRIVPWRSTVLRAALGEIPPHSPPKDPTSCAMRRLYGYVAGSPEETCDPAAAPPARPSLAVLRDTLFPMLVKRGCTDGGCHGDGAGDLSLFATTGDKHAPLHDYLVLTARIEPGKPAADTTMLLKTRNVDPHGGGTRLGGEGDCFDAATVAWIEGRPVASCKPRQPPGFAGFKADIQEVLDRMTCTQSSCHGGALDHFKLVPHATSEADLRANYVQTLTELDLDYMPFSPVMLRMREPCAYSVTGAWIEGKARPGCPLVDPDPALFPRVPRGRVHPGEGMGM